MMPLTTGSKMINAGIRQIEPLELWKELSIYAIAVAVAMVILAVVLIVTIKS
jgi:hypothetical protein